MIESKQKRTERRRTKERLREDIRNIKRQQDIELDVKVEGIIDLEKQRSYTMALFEEQAKQTELVSKNEYDKNPISWMQSASSRARLVIIEATQTNVKQLARVIMTASPLERVLIVGLEAEKMKDFETEIRSLWSQKLRDSSESYKKHFKDHFKEGDNDLRDIYGLVDNLPLKELLGPHLIKRDLDISYTELTNEFPHFETSIEEILCFGNTDVLSKKLPLLAIEKELPYLAIRAEASQEDSLHLWRCSSRDQTEFLDKIVSGKSALDLLSNNSGKYQSVNLSTSFEASFQLDLVRAKMEERGGVPEDRISNLQQQDIDYLKSLFIDEALYPANTSPLAITKIISKATSKLGALGAEKVGKALVWNLVNRPVSTAEGVHFAVGSMTLDGGNDIVKEDLDRKTAYKKLYDNLLSNALITGKNHKDAIEFAATELINTYCATEKENKIIHSLIKGEGGANEWRTLGLEASNKVKKANTKGIKHLKPMVWLFAIGILLATIGITLATMGVAGIAIPAAVGLVVAATGITATGIATGLTGSSMYNQRKANYKYLPEANFCFAQANTKQFTAQRERETELSKRLVTSKEVLKEEAPEQEIYLKFGNNQTQKVLSTQGIQLDKLKKVATRQSSIGKTKKEEKVIPLINKKNHRTKL